MKKLLAILLALLVVAPLFVVATATVTDDTKTFSVCTENTSDYYNSNSEINLVLALRDVNFGEGDGISALEFELYYDKEMLSPLVTASEDSDGDAGDFGSLMTANPGDWEGFGVLDSNEGFYSLAFSDIMGEATVVNDDELVITIPFMVNKDAKLTDLVFSFDNVIAYNTGLETMAEIELESVVIKYSVQPAMPESFPDDVIRLTTAGYLDDISNLVYYAKEDITVGEFVNKFCTPTENQDKMSGFAILVADLNGIISYVDLDVSVESDKSAVVIPAESYIIGVSCDNEADYDKFADEAKVGKRVTIYNVNIEATGNFDSAITLTNAGFEITDALDCAPPFVGGDEPLTPAPAPALVGDVNNNGVIDALDYFVIKRAYFGKYIIRDIRVADVNFNGVIDSMDYITLKRVYFGNQTI
ncbi:MAG: hypothetical protein E7586_03205 [Ruminococcaceae bacterium]|nr:hypothetical protein [Oscillospiraceae bacterium]